jgi:hypothetical protein
MFNPQLRASTVPAREVAERIDGMDAMAPLGSRFSAGRVLSQGSNYETALNRTQMAFYSPIMAKECYHLSSSRNIPVEPHLGPPLSGDALKEKPTVSLASCSIVMPAMLHLN